MAKTKKKVSTAAVLRITQVKSVIGTPEDQRGTIRALGLKRINDTVDQANNEVIRGMVFKVKHLIKVEEL